MRNEEALATAIKALIDEQISNLDFSDVVADVIPTLDLDDLLRPTIDGLVESAVDGIETIDMDDVHRDLDFYATRRLAPQVGRLIRTEAPDIVSAEIKDLLDEFPEDYSARCEMGRAFTRAVTRSLKDVGNGYDLPGHVEALSLGMGELMDMIRELQAEVATLKERQPLPPPMVKFAIPTGGGTYFIDGTEYAPVAK